MNKETQLHLEMHYAFENIQRKVEIQCEDAKREMNREVSEILRGLRKNDSIIKSIQDIQDISALGLGGNMNIIVSPWVSDKIALAFRNPIASCITANT